MGQISPGAGQGPFGKEIKLSSDCKNARTKCVFFRIVATRLQNLLAALHLRVSRLLGGSRHGPCLTRVSGTIVPRMRILRVEESATFVDP